MQRLPRRANWIWALVLASAAGCRMGYDALALAGNGSGASAGTGSESGAGASSGGSANGAGGASAGSTSAGGATGGTGSGSGGTGATGGAVGTAGAAGEGGAAGCAPTNGGVEACDGLDNDCNGSVDDGAPCATDCFTASYGTHGYLFCRTQVLFSVAQATCAQNSMSLIRIDDSPENAWVAATAYADPTLALTFALFIGASDAAVEGEWRWPDGEQFWSGDSTGGAVGGLYASWASKEPNQKTGDEDCSGLRGDGTWYDVRCDGSGSEMAFGCESP